MISDGVVYAVTAWGQFIDNFAKVDSSKFNEVVHSGAYIRQCIGQYQNGDYCVCTVDGTRNTFINENGMTYDELADLLISKGVKFAYALDGGGSAETVIGQRQINLIYEGTEGRAVPTVIYFGVGQALEHEDNSIYWAHNVSSFGITNNKVVLNSGYPNRISAYQKSGEYPFHLGGDTGLNEAYPVKIPTGATAVVVSVPDGLMHGVIFYKCGGETTLISDIGWKSGEITYDLSNYATSTHFTVNVKSNDNGDISTVDTNAFSVSFK